MPTTAEDRRVIYVSSQTHYVLRQLAARLGLSLIDTVGLLAEQEAERWGLSVDPPEA